MEKNVVVRNVFPQQNVIVWNLYTTEGLKGIYPNSGCGSQPNDVFGKWLNVNYNELLWLEDCDNRASMLTVGMHWGLRIGDFAAANIWRLASGVTRMGRTAPGDTLQVVSPEGKNFCGQIYKE